MVARGKLSMTKINGYCYYSLEEVERVELEKRKPRSHSPQTRTIKVQDAHMGEKDAIAFDMFAAGSSLVDIVRVLRIPYDRVERLYDVYVNPNLEERRRKRIVEGL